MSAPICEGLVLIVEDDLDLRDSLAEILEDNEYRPLGAANGQEAMARLRAEPHKPCVILLDIMMPVMDGWQFRALQRAGNVLAAAACLKKPVHIATLLTTVERFCRKAGSSA